MNATGPSWSVGDAARHLRMDLRTSTRSGGLNRLVGWHGREEVGSILFDQTPRGRLCMWSVRFEYLRHGVGSALTDYLRTCYPGVPLLAHPSGENTASGNAFIAAYNRRVGPATIRMRADRARR